MFMKKMDTRRLSAPAPWAVYMYMAIIFKLLV